jgi:hypothetical protein
MTVSDRLKDTIEAYCGDTDDLDDLTQAVENGHLDWFPAEFAAAIRAGEFTPRSWERLTDVAMDDDEDVLLDHYLRQVWAAAAPGRPYPLDA